MSPANLLSRISSPLFLNLRLRSPGLAAVFPPVISFSFSSSTITGGGIASSPPSTAATSLAKATVPGGGITSTPPSTAVTATATATIPDGGVTLTPPSTAASASTNVVDTKYGVLQPRVLIYDGVCHLCHRGVKWVIKVDDYRKIKFCCLQSKTAEPYLDYCGLEREDVVRRVLFVEGPGSYFQGSAALSKVASYLPFPYNMLSSLLIVPAPLRDAAYDFVAKRRNDWFGKEDDCIVKSQKELLERFIDRHEMLDDYEFRRF